jgi:cytochrome c oxidase subunit 2
LPSVFSPHSPQTHSIAAVFSLVLLIAAVVFLTVVAGVTYSAIRYRSRGAPPSEPRQVFGSPKLEILWTVLPLAIVTGLFIVTVRAMVVIDAPQDSPATPDLVITGHQWWWEARYPSGVIVPWDIHIPTGRRLLARIESGDVIHDFWVPELARKIDAVPGRASFIWLQADSPGTYLGACSEFCGAQHAWMRFRVMAERESDYEAWMRNERPRPSNEDDIPGSPVPLAVRLFADKCATCHARTPTDDSGSGKGPSLAHIASRETLGGGIQRNTPENLMLWLTNPQAAKPGNRMPTIQLSPAESATILAFLETLK